MKDLTGKIVYYMFPEYRGFSLSKVKLIYHVSEKYRDLEGEDEYNGKIVKHIYGDPLIDAEVLYVSDMYFTDRDLMKNIFIILKG